MRRWTWSRALAIRISPFFSPSPICEPGWTTRSANAEQLAALDLDGHGLDRFLPQSSSSGLARLIRYDVWATGSTIPVSSSADRNAATCSVGQGRGVPLVVVLREELDGLEADGLRRSDGAIAASRDRHVRAESSDGPFTFAGFACCLDHRLIMLQQDRVKKNRGHSSKYGIRIARYKCALFSNRTPVIPAKRSRKSR